MCMFNHTKAIFEWQDLAAYLNTHEGLNVTYSMCWEQTSSEG